MTTSILDQEHSEQDQTPIENGGRRAGTLSSPIVAALEATWAAIQVEHDEVPDVVVVLASGSFGVPRGLLRLGHFRREALAPHRRRWRAAAPGGLRGR